MLFLPVNKHLHWSLCLFNPGSVMQLTDSDEILITIDEVHDLLQQALYEAEAKALKEAKKKNNGEEYDEFNAEEQLEQLINFTADKVVARVEAQAESRAHAEAEVAKGTKRKRQTLKKKMSQTEDSPNRKKL
jgi:hypothetical protein